MGTATPSNVMDAITALAKRRGFIFPSGEIYGGISGFWDYGPLGVELRRNIRDAWWAYMVQKRDDVVGLDSAIITHPQTWVASGHVEHFHDEMVDCRNCKRRFKVEAVDEGRCPFCGSGDLTEPRPFHLMMKTTVGALEDETSVAYLRPETCQPIFTDFDLIRQSSRLKLPFGVAQVGKAFRNEINPRNFTARSREFEQMEMEFFCRAEEAPKWFEHWKNYRWEWYQRIGFKKENLRFREHEHKELAHYATQAVDIEFNFPFGWMEFEGIHNRTDYDLRSHTQASGKALEYYDEDTKEHITPYVIETSAGLDRILLALLCDAYSVDKAPTGAEARQAGREEEEERIVLRFSPLIAPVKVAVLPLRRKLGEEALKIYRTLKKIMPADYDEAGSIGKRYRRQDEVGTPWCVTFDFESLEDKKVTIRDRDTLKQERVPIDDVPALLKSRLESAQAKLLMD